MSGIQGLQNNQKPAANDLDALNQRTLYAGEKQQITYKNDAQKLKSKMQNRSKVFRTQNETESACIMNLDVKSCQVQCA